MDHPTESVNNYYIFSGKLRNYLKFLTGSEIHLKRSFGTFFSIGPPTAVTDMIASDTPFVVQCPQSSIHYYNKHKGTYKYPLYKTDSVHLP